MKPSIAMSLFFGVHFAGAAIADDWPMFGRDRTRNSVSPERNPPTDWAIKGAASKVQRNVKWSAQCGSNSHGFIAVSGGLIWIGSNNEYPRDPAFKGDASVLMCFREADGRFLYQHVSPRLKSGRVNDWPFNGISNAPLIEGDRLWFTTTRCETICLDIAPLLKDSGPAKEVWKLDMMGELGVFPLAEGMGMGRTCSIAASYRDLIYVITGNGVDGSRRDVHSPKAPSLLCLNKNTGKVIWNDNSPGPNILAGQWASPLVVEIGGRGQVVAPQGDGWLRSFDALTGKLIWKFDTNEKDTVWPVDRNSLHASPVYYDGRIYIAGGQEVEHGEGPGHLWCIDPTKEGDISAELGEWGKPGKPNPNSGVVWDFQMAGPEPENTMHRTISSVAIHDGLVIAPDFSGYVHCLDAKTGKHYWAHDVWAAIWSTPLICDGKVYVCDEDGEVCIFELAKEKKLVAEHGFPSAAYCSPVYVNGVLYLASRERLYAIAAPKAPQPPAQPPEEPMRRLPRAAVFVPTPQDVVEKMLEVAGVGKGDVVWDLGSGDGRIVISAAKKYGVKAVGVEIDPQLAKVSRESAAAAGVGDLVSIRQADLFAQDLAGATVITLYLGERNNERLIPKLKSLPPGVRIVSYCFPMKGIQPSKVVKFRTAAGEEEHTLYLWTTPLRDVGAQPQP